MPAPREIERLIDKYRQHRLARAGEPLVVDERLREHMMSVVEDQYGAANFVSSKEAAENYAQSLAWQKGVGRWWHKMVPWVGFAGVACLAMIVIFIAANHGPEARHAAATDTAPERSAGSAPARATGAAPPVRSQLEAAKAGMTATDNAAVGDIAPAARAEMSKTAPALTTAPAPSPRPAPSLQINAPRPDPSAPMAEESADIQPTAQSIATAPRLAGARSATAPRMLDAGTAPASELVPVSPASTPAPSSAKKPAPRRPATKMAPVNVSPLPPPAALPTQTIEPIAGPAEINSAPTIAVAPAMAPPANRSRASTPVPPQTPIVWEAPKAQIRGGRNANRAAATVSAPAATPRMQKFRSVGPADYQRAQSSPRGFAIMRQFDLLTAGGNITIKDADGSIYKGSVSSVRGSQFSFRTAGVNRTSGQRVEFNGRYAPVAAEPTDPRPQVTGAALEGEIKVAGGRSRKLAARRIR